MIEDFISEEEIEAIKSHASKVLSSGGHHDEHIDIDGFDPNLMDEGMVTTYQKVTERFISMCQELYGKSLIKNTFLYKRMRVGAGHTPHVDNPFDSYPMQAYVGSLMLTDDYEGGVFRFPYRDVAIKPAKGGLILFLGNEKFVHEVDQITQGVRDTILMYAYDPEVADPQKNYESVKYELDSNAPYGVRLI